MSANSTGPHERFCLCQDCIPMTQAFRQNLWEALRSGELFEDSGDDEDVIVGAGEELWDQDTEEDPDWTPIVEIDMNARMPAKKRKKKVAKSKPVKKQKLKK